MVALAVNLNSLQFLITYCGREAKSGQPFVIKLSEIWLLWLSLVVKLCLATNNL